MTGQSGPISPPITHRGLEWARVRAAITKLRANHQDQPDTPRVTPHEVRLADSCEELLDEVANLNYAIDHGWSRGQYDWACAELTKLDLTPCAGNFDWLATTGGG